MRETLKMVMKAEEEGEAGIKKNRYSESTYRNESRDYSLHVKKNQIHV